MAGFTHHTLSKRGTDRGRPCRATQANRKPQSRGMPAPQGTNRRERGKIAVGALDVHGAPPPLLPPPPRPDRREWCPTLLSLQPAGWFKGDKENAIGIRRLAATALTNGPR